MKTALEWFKFKPEKWQNGAVQFCSLPAQGLLINIFGLYWKRNCQLSKKHAYSKFDNALLDELIDEDVLKVRGEKIVIDFLDEQYLAQSTSKKEASANGKKGAEKRWGRYQNIEHKQEVPLSNTTIAVPHFYIGKDLYTLPVSEYIRDNMAAYLEIIRMQNKQVDIDVALSTMDREYPADTFSSEVHIKNAFKKIAFRQNSFEQKTIKGKATMPKRVDID